MGSEIARHGHVSQVSCTDVFEGDEDYGEIADTFGIRSAAEHGPTTTIVDRYVRMSRVSAVVSRYPDAASLPNILLRRQLEPVELCLDETNTLPR